MITFLAIKCHPTCWISTKAKLETFHGIGDLHAMWGIVLNDIGLAELTSHSKFWVEKATYALIIAGTLEFCFSMFIIFIGFWLVRFSVLGLGLYLAIQSWAGLQGMKTCSAVELFLFSLFFFSLFFMSCLFVFFFLI